MRLTDVLRESSYDSHAAFQEIKKIDSAYEDLKDLATAINRGSWAVLIGKTDNEPLTSMDIYEIGEKLVTILYFNPLFDGKDMRGLEDSQWETFAEKVGHGFEAAAMGAITAALVGGAAFLAGTASPILAGIAGVGGLMTARSTFKQATMAKSLEAAEKLYDIMSAWKNMFATAGSIQRTKWQKFKDFIARKTPEEIRLELVEEARAIAKKNQILFAKKLKRLPQVLHYVDNLGDNQSITISELLKEIDSKGSAIQFAKMQATKRVS